MILRGDVGLLVAMGDDRDKFLNWLQGTGCNAVGAVAVYYDTNTSELVAHMTQKVELGDGQMVSVRDEETGGPLITKETYHQTPIDPVLLGRWLAYAELRRAEAQTFIVS